MKKIICSCMTGMLFFLSGCNIPQGQIKKQEAPGQINKTAGEHPVSIELNGQVELRGEYNHDVNKKK